MNVHEIFDTLKQHKTNYLVLENWDALPGDYGSGIHVLVESERIFCSLLGATRINGPSFLVGEIPFTIREKGRDLLPEVFESLLMERAVMHQDSIRVPDDRNGVWLMLYRRLYHDGAVTNPTEKKLYERVLDERVGRPVVPKDKDIQLQYRRV